MLLIHVKEIIKDIIMVSSFNVVDIVRKCYKNAAVKDILKMEKECSFTTYSHSIAAAIYSAMILKEYCVEESFIENVVAGALIHDVGKIVVAKEILEKKDKLTPTEINKIHKHPVKGYELVKGVFGEIPENTVLLHHEKLDGSGYLYGITEIPFYVQAVTVADMYDALTSSRSYKKAYSHETAVDILRGDAQRGKLSTDVVEIINNIRK